MALASGLGGLPFFFTQDFSKQSEGIANAIAGGVMLAVAFDLLNEPFCSNDRSLSTDGPAVAGAKAVVGVITGSWFIRASQGARQAYVRV